MESPKTSLVANLGTTSEPVIEALETAAAEGALTLFLVYGKAISAQERTPFNEAHKVSEKARQLGVNCLVSELATPEEFDGSFKFFQRLMDEVQWYVPTRVIVDITGGTKVMSAALVHAALTQQWGAEVIFEYWGGQRDSSGRVNRGAMQLKRDNGIITQERVATVLDTIRRQEFALAAFLAGGLPEHGKAGFVRKATAVFWLWDNFHYEQAEQLLKEITARRKCSSMTGSSRKSLTPYYACKK